MTVPLEHAWNQHESPVDETQFTPWAEPGWLAHNGQSPEVAVVDFARHLIRMMQPLFVIETGVGQGYMTRAIVPALSGTSRFVAFESDDDWREMLWPLEFWNHRPHTTLSSEPTPSDDEFAAADLCILDSEFELRFTEVVHWNEFAKPGAVALIHDTSDRDGTIHKSLRGLIQDLGMTGVFLNNPRGCFMAVQPKEKRWDASPAATDGST